MLSLRIATLPVVLLVTNLINIAEAQRPRRPFQRPNRAADTLKEGDAAPDFSLRVMKGKAEEKVTLSDFQGDRPVALIFGSYT